MHQITHETIKQGLRVLPRVLVDHYFEQRKQAWQARFRGRYDYHSPEFLAECLSIYTSLAAQVNAAVNTLSGDDPQ